MKRNRSDRSSSFSSNEERKMRSSDMVVCATNKVNRVANKFNLKNVTKPIQEKSPQQIRRKLNLKQKEKEKLRKDPFDDLGEGIVKLVENSMRHIQMLKNPDSNCPLQNFNQAYKEIVTKYLIFGAYQLFILNQCDDFTKNQLTLDQVRVMYGLAARIQEQIYEAYNFDLKSYKSKCKMILNNLKDYSNKELRHKLVDGKMTARELALSKQSDLDSTKTKEMNKEKMKYLLAEVEVEIKDNQNLNQEGCTYEDYSCTMKDNDKFSESKTVNQDSYNSNSLTMKGSHQKIELGGLPDIVKSTFQKTALEPVLMDRN